ncbi:MAG TPA: DsbA family protein [Vicinamibacterales bacterium]|jgi:protein-disulfide isomerase
MRTVAGLLAICLLLGPSLGSAGAQGITQQQADDMLKELRGIRAVLERMAAGQASARPTTPPPAPDPRVRLPKVGGHVLGKPDAPITMVEFTDLQCQYCARFANGAFPQIKSEYIDKGLVRFVTRDFPLDIHPHAELAARASRCAGEQGRFWEVRRTLMINYSKLNPDFITATATDAKLDMAAFTGCLSSGRFKDEIRKELDEAFDFGVEGTPTFFIGRTQGEGLEGQRVVGALPFEMFDAKFKELLKK